MESMSEFRYENGSVVRETDLLHVTSSENR